jgi:transcriptional regulator with XRE-family HTH domain
MSADRTQFRMAISALELTVHQVAKASNINANTITRIENGKDAKQSTLNKLREFYESQRVEFSSNGGVKLKKK